ncbi:MAG: DUF374 domain-containing protein [Proteobacteria bacterium]|nr:DUF374 domain-containing protein [Pseudomonadota bacterium]
MRSFLRAAENMRSFTCCNSGNQMTVRPRFLTELITRLRLEIVAATGALLLRTIAATIRWKEPRRNQELFQRIEMEPCIFVFWHDRQLLMFSEYQRYRSKLVALASRHNDGRIIARILEWLGFRTVAGSSSKGGAVALSQLVKLVREGWDVGITPDGPKGPRHVLKEGVVKLAQLTGAKIVPLCYAVERRWSFRSWDRIFLPKPFSRGVALVGTPISVPRNADLETIQSVTALIQAELERVTTWCDTHEFR